MLDSKQYIEGRALAKELIDFYIKANGKLHEDSWTVNLYKLSKIIIKPLSSNKNLIDKFNNLYRRIRNCKSFTELVRTRSGGISIDKFTLLERPFQYDIRTTSINTTITFVTDLGCGRIVCGYDKKKKQDENYFGSGSTCAKRIWEVAEEFNINKDNYRCEDGLEIAKEIHKPINANYAILDQVYNNVHHLDFHKFYPSGVVECYPEFKQVFEKLLLEKNGKQIMDAGTRYWASKYCDYKYAKLIKDGINKSYEHLEEVLEELVNAGRKPLMINTDGIWYQGEIFHGYLEGDGFGQWSNDYINCQWRAKTESTGCYEFIGTDTKTNITKYYAKVKGTSTLDAVKDRDHWEWGDIYKTVIISASWDDDDGYIVEL